MSEGPTGASTASENWEADKAEQIEMSQPEPILAAPDDGLIPGEKQPQDNRLVEFVNGLNEHGGSYHQLNLGKGIVVRGEYDMSEYIDHYHLPASLEGKEVLDIGTATGYFALECARRGAQVTAIDIRQAPRLTTIAQLTGAHISFVRKSIYELEPTFGQFDLVVCGSLLLHLPDPFGAIQHIRSVCRGRAVVATACPADSADNPRPVCEFTGMKAAEADYWTYWLVGAEALRRMFLAAGFHSVETVEHFTLATTPDARWPFVSPHVVATGVVA